MPVSAYSEANYSFNHYGCRSQPSAVDAVGAIITHAQEALSRGKITGALLMDVAAAFPSVACEYLP